MFCTLIIVIVFRYKLNYKEPHFGKFSWCKFQTNSLVKQKLHVLDQHKKKYRPLPFSADRSKKTPSILLVVKLFRIRRVTCPLDARLRNIHTSSKVNLTVVSLVRITFMGMLREHSSEVLSGRILIAATCVVSSEKRFLKSSCRNTSWNAAERQLAWKNCKTVKERGKWEKRLKIKYRQILKENDRGEGRKRGKKL